MAAFTHEPLRLEPSKRTAIIVLVVALHLLLLYLFSLIRATYPVQPEPWPIVNLELFRSGGSGATAEVEVTKERSLDPALPSAIHAPETVTPWPDTPPAPPEPAEQQLIVGAGETAAPVIETPRTEVAAVGVSGEGGSGSGVGTGSGSGVGPGTGRGGSSGAVLIRAPRGAIMSQNVSQSALAALPGAYVVFRCDVLLSQRLSRCLVLAQSPADEAVRERAQERLAEVRMRPPTRSGRYINSRVTMAIAFPPDA